MSEYGIKIMNYEAASIYEHEEGLRSKLDSTKAMLSNSLFLEYLKENGLKIYKGESTRDVICIAFSYGTRTYEEEKKIIERSIKKAKESNNKEKENSLLFYLENTVEKNKDKYVKIKKEELRIKYYTEGLQITYKKYIKNEIVTDEIIRYRMLFRTPGKAKKGTCMFIREELYEKAHNFLYMGIELPKNNSPIVEIGAYSSLITSSIVGKVRIRPEEILIVKDLKTLYRSKAIKVYTDENKECRTKEVENYDIEGEAFDGQALIDSSIFPTWGNGYILLRHHFTKMAAFNTNIELFMRDQFKEEYDTAEVEDMFGRKVRVRDIKLITTNNAIKFLKFNIGIDYWFNWISKNDYNFGIVKTAHESKISTNVQRMSYQMTNSLNLETMEETTALSCSYIDKLKSDDEAFIEYLRKNSNFSNDYEVLVALCDRNRNFVNSEYFRDRKRKIIENYVLDFKGGRIIQNADNLTIVGSPYGMLLHAIGKDAREDSTFKTSNNYIECYTERFKDGEYLAAFRSPFNSRNNLDYLYNVKDYRMSKYFNLGELCIAVNTIDTEFQSRNNGLR